MKYIVTIAVLLCGLSLPGQAFPLRLLNEETPEEALEWADRMLDDVANAVKLIDDSLLGDERSLPVFPLLEIRKAQNACETLQGELRMRTISQRIPKEIRYSTASRKAVRDLCFELAREKDRILSGRPIEDLHLIRLKQKSEGTRQTLYYAYFLHSSPYIRLMRKG